MHTAPSRVPREPRHQRPKFTPTGRKMLLLPHDNNSRANFAKACCAALFSVCNESNHQLMKQKPNQIITGLALVLALALALNQSKLAAQTNTPPPPPPAPSAGLVNDYLRKQSDGFKD